jgi:hypothetical protein
VPPQRKSAVAPPLWSRSPPLLAPPRSPPRVKTAHSSSGSSPRAPSDGTTNSYASHSPAVFCEESKDCLWPDWVFAWVQTIQGNNESRVTSLVWGQRGGEVTGRLLSSSVDGSVCECDLFYLQQKVSLFACLHSIFSWNCQFRTLRCWDMHKAGNWCMSRL